MTMAMCAMTAW